MILVIALFFKQRHDFFKKVRDGSTAYSSSSSSSSQATHKPLFRTGASSKSDIKWDDIMDATRNLSEEFMIGSGGSGKIYKAELENGETVAVKKILWKDDLMSNKSFSREVKTLGIIKHRRILLS